MKLSFTLALLIPCLVEGQSYNAGISGDLHDVFFINDNVGWAYTYGTGIVYATKDGGVRWQKTAQLDSMYFEQMQFFDAKSGFICGEKGKIYFTADEGVTWASRSIISKPDESLLLYAMLFKNKVQGLVAGMRMSADRRVLGYEGYSTDDGGLSWQPILNFPNAMFTKFIDARGSTLAASSNSIYRMDLNTGKFELIYQDADKEIGHVRGMQLIDSKVIVASGFNGYFVKSIDQGATWTKKKISDEKIRDIYFGSLSHGWAIGNNGAFLETKDGGETWKQVDFTRADLHRIRAAKKFVYIVGKKATVLKLKTK